MLAQVHAGGMADHAPDPHVLDPAHLPTPFTADELRAGCPAGRTLRSRAEFADGTVEDRVYRFDEVDHEGAVIESWSVRLDGGREAGDRLRTSWRDLQSHASFPADRTLVEHVSLTTELGEMSCVRYIVQLGDGRTNRFWFDTGRPGMPVAYDVVDAHGEPEEAVTVVSDEVLRE